MTAALRLQKIGGHLFSDEFFSRDDGGIGVFISSERFCLIFSISKSRFSGVGLFGVYFRFWEVMGS